MNKKLLFTTLAITFLSSHVYAGTIKTISSVYALEGGTYFDDGEIKTQTSSGGLFYGMGEDGHFFWIGTGSKKDEYGDIFSSYGFADYRRTSNALTFSGYGGIAKNETDRLSGASFLNSEFNWNFKIEGNDAVLNYVFLSASGTGTNSLYDVTNNKWLFNTELAKDNVMEGNYALLNGHEYLYANTYTSFSRSMEGYINMRFENATMQLPAPTSLGFLAISLLTFAGLKKRT